LSDIDHDASLHLKEKNARGWYRTDGKPFTDRVDDLTNGIMWYPPRFDEHGTDIGLDADTFVATGTFSNGSGNFIAEDCSSWPTAAGEGLGGYADSSARLWTDATTTTCSVAVHIYCFGVDKNVAVPAPVAPAGSRLAFVTAATLGGGVPGLASTCNG